MRARNHDQEGRKWVKTLLCGDGELRVSCDTVTWAFLGLGCKSVHVRMGKIKRSLFSLKLLSGSMQSKDYCDSQKISSLHFTVEL